MKSAHLCLGALATGMCCVACSLLIGGEATPLGCSEEGKAGPPACDPGFVCRSGLCEEAAAAGGSPGEGGAAGAGASTS